MNLDLDLHRLFAYEFWADRETLVSLQRADDKAPPRASEIMAHVLAASRLWLARLSMEKIKIEVWPARTLTQMTYDLTALESAWQRWLASPIPARLDDLVSYVNSKGEPWSSTARDILMHMFLHASYHRGQIATLLGRGGHQPVYTDFIHATRQGIV